MWVLLDLPAGCLGPVPASVPGGRSDPAEPLWVPRRRIPGTGLVFELRGMSSRSWDAADPSRLCAGLHVCSGTVQPSSALPTHPSSILAGKVLVPNLNPLCNLADTGFVFIFSFSLRFCETFYGNGNISIIMMMTFFYDFPRSVVGIPDAPASQRGLGTGSGVLQDLERELGWPGVPSSGNHPGCRNLLQHPASGRDWNHQSEPTAPPPAEISS